MLEYMLLPKTLNPKDWAAVTRYMGSWAQCLSALEKGWQGEGFRVGLGFRV